MPAIGLTTDRLRIETVERLYAEGYPDSVAERRYPVLGLFGAQMNGCAGQRAAGRIVELANGAA